MGASSSKDTELDIKSDKIIITSPTGTQTITRTQGMCLETKIQGTDCKIYYDRIEIPQIKKKIMFNKPKEIVDL